MGIGGNSAGEEPQKAFLRERFRARCLERAARARAKKIKGKRFVGESEGSSDGYDETMDCENEEGDEDMMQDEVRFSRVLLFGDAWKKDQISCYTNSYSQE
jgi:hypothetical protein